MDVIESGTGELLCTTTPEEAREWMRREKERKLVDKIMSAKDAVKKFIHNGSYVSIGGFGQVRISMPIIHEMIRQGKKNLKCAGHTAVHDFDVLVAGGCVEAVDVAYIIGYEVRGLSTNSRKMVESGKIRTVEWTNGALSWRYKAAAMGVPYVPTRVMMGTDTFKRSAAKIVECPFTGMRLCLVPALYPDVAFIHVHRCDIYGNAQIDGVLVKDNDLARAAKRLILTTEEIIPTEEVRKNPERTVIPYYCVDAVVEAPWGSHPGNMPFVYYFDEEHIAEYLKASEDPEKVQAYLHRYIYSVEDYDEYLGIIGFKKLNYLKKLEQLRVKDLTPKGEEAKV